MLPEIWLPTCTLSTGFNVPVAVTACTRSPRVTAVVWNFGLSSAESLPNHQTAAAAPPISTRRNNHFPKLNFEDVAIKLPVKNTLRSVSQFHFCTRSKTPTVANGIGLAASPA